MVEQAKINCPSCGVEILRLPAAVKAVKRAIAKHLPVHPMGDREKLETQVILQVFEKMAELN